MLDQLVVWCKMPSKYGADIKVIRFINVKIAVLVLST